ncbi:hypothetical protein L484_003623 [Morus notabilis]|uniref:Survival Motor Neuron Gemin2-binding domain-containing protein n=2 Tax=Morus notabilis TaxID=981085 RepID=W9S513_9ROSA|nr:hypothetical protein L484_003623 [Morus notabilis]
MGRQGDLWDDSALLNAFDDAISKYKIMHGKKSGDVSNDGELISSCGDHLVADVDDHQEATRQEGADDKSNLPSSTVTEMGESSNPSLVKEKQSVDPHVPEPYAEVAQDVQKSYSYLQDAHDYNQLLNQYYELEQKRQQIIGQLHQYGSWNYQSYGDGSGSTFQEHPLPVCQASNPTTFCTCCPYASQCFAAPCTSLPSCFLGGSCVGKSCADACEVTNFRKSSPQVDSNIVETAMGAAERAIASMREKVSGDSNSTEGNIEKEKHSTERAVVSPTSSETDLTVVLNAWYSAGFYTGKYLVEQSIAKKRQS